MKTACSSVSLVMAARGKERDFNQIYLSEPTVQRALGCQPEEKQNCMANLKPGGIAPVSAGLGESGATAALAEGVQ